MPSGSFRRTTPGTGGRGARPSILCRMLTRRTFLQLMAASTGAALTGSELGGARRRGLCRGGRASEPDRQHRDHREQDNHGRCPGDEQAARSAGPGRARSGAIDASRPGVHDLTLSTTVKKRVSIRPESAEEGKRVIGTVSWHRAEVTGRGESGGRLVVIRWPCPSAALSALLLPEVRAEPGHPGPVGHPDGENGGRDPGCRPTRTGVGATD